MTRRQQKQGKHGQQLAASYLSGNVGLLMVEEIGTPVRLIPAMAGLFKVIYGEKVSGDHRALLPDGCSVLIETKTTEADRLTYSHLRPHQPERLTAHARIGRAVSLLVWVYDSVYVMRWGADGIAGFGPRKSITVDMARKLHIETIMYLLDRMAK